MPQPDPFDTLLELEATLLQRGFEEGARSGELAGFAEGHALGTARGGAVGEELGFYCGAAEAVLLSRSAATGAAPGGDEAGDRVRRIASQIVALARAAELVNPPAAAASGDDASGGGSAPDDGGEAPSEPPVSGAGTDVFAVLQHVRAKFRLLAVLAKVPGLCFDPTLRRGEKERSF